MAILARRRQKSFSPWYGFLILAVLFVAFTLKIVDGLKPDPVAPKADVPAVSYQDVVKDDEVDEADDEVVDVVEPDPEPQPEPDIEPEPTVQEPEEIPAEFNLALPFTSQAPTGNWDALHEDACEEASFYMVQQFYAGVPEGKIDPAIADPELQRLVHAEEALGLTPSISVAEAQDFLMKDSGTVAVIVENPTVEMIKELVASGKPVIVPAAGRELGNPFFTGEGPLYHMLVIRGYTETTFITNDPGTRMGENYVYDIDVMMEAIGDWINEDPESGPKRVMYIEPK